MMPTVFRTFKTRLDPATGKRVRVMDKGRPVPHAKWRFEFVDWQGRRRSATGTVDKRETEALAVRLEAEAEAVRKGWRPPPKQADKSAARAFADVAAEYRAWGEASGGRGGRPWGAGHARMRRAHLAWWENRLGLQTLGDVAGALPKVEAALREKGAAGTAGKTLANIAEALGGLCRWAINRGYLEVDPLKHLARFDTEPRTRRRAMTGDEIKRLLEAVRPARRLVYEVAFLTGFRRRELRSLTVGDINPDRPALHIRAEFAKSRKAAMQPLPLFLWEKLREVAKGKNQDAPLLAVPFHTARVMDNDLKRAGIPKWNPLGKIDFHSCRVAFITMILESGADIKTAMTLARHSTPDLTMNVYARPRQERLDRTSEAVGAMILAEPKNITGTERKAVGYEMLAISAGYSDKVAGSSPVYPAIFPATFQYHVADSQDTNPDKTPISCGPAGSDEKPSRSIRGHSDTYGDHIKDRDFRGSLRNRHGTETLPPDLAEVVGAWPDLPAEVREAVRLMVKAAATRPRRKGSR